MAWLIENKALVLGGLLVLSELLAGIPSIKANSIFQLFVGFIKQMGAPQLPPKA